MIRHALFMDIHRHRLHRQVASLLDPIPGITLSIFNVTPRFHRFHTRQLITTI